MLSGFTEDISWGTLTHGNLQGLSKSFERSKHVPVRNTTLPLMKYGEKYIRTYLKFIWSAPNYFIIQPVGGRLTSETLMGICWSSSGSVRCRIDICSETKGAHIEHLWADFCWKKNWETYSMLRFRIIGNHVEGCRVWLSPRPGVSYLTTLRVALLYFQMLYNLCPNGFILSSDIGDRGADCL
jgi:hypothetical protein